MEKSNMADASVLRELDAKAETMKKAVLETENKSGFAGTVYYVSESGRDDNDGKTPEKAIRTMAKVAELDLKPGDAVLFERGGEFRGKLLCKAGVTYSAYGKGTKPIINGSRMNYAQAEWSPVQGYENVYRCSEKVNNAGIMAFDHEKVPGYYDGKVGIMKNPDEIIRFKHVVPFHGIQDLHSDGEFYNDLSDNSLYLYCDKGNPSQVYRSIEVGDAGNCFSVRESDCTVDNLFIMFTGSHGVGGGGIRNLTVTNCVFAWIGGSVLKGYGGGNHTRYGNAVEIYGSCDGYHVMNNWIYQIYDTGITHQCSHSSDGSCTMKNVEYRDNLIEYCNWSIEYYNRDDAHEDMRLVDDVHVHHNMCRYAGYGWGKQRPDKCATHCNSFGLTGHTENFVIEDNIFDRSNYFLVRLCDDAGDRRVIYRRNTYVQSPEKDLGLIFDKKVPYQNVEETICQLYHEENPTVYYVE